ncbi:tetratricopeptide repeat protein [Lysinibacillus sphaericus]
MEDFIQFVSTLPNRKLRKYETGLAQYASNKLTKHECAILTDWLKQSTDRNEEANDPENPILFSIFFVLCIYARRMKNHSTYKNLIQDYGEFFEGELLYPHIVSLFHKQYDTPEDMELAIHYGRMAVENLPHQVGVLHSYVESVVAAEERGLDIDQAIVGDAREKMDQIIRMDNQYPKFYCTKGRLLAVLKQYREAKTAIHKAIDKEDSSSTDYAIRLNEYQSHLSRIEAAESSSLILDELEKTRSELEESKLELEISMDKMQKDNLQSIAFFVAIISLTIGSFNLIGNKPFLDSAFLIMILTGCILIGYLSLGMLLQQKKSPWKHQVFILLIGLLLIAGPLYSHYLSR